MLCVWTDFLFLRRVPISFLYLSAADVLFSVQEGILLLGRDFSSSRCWGVGNGTTGWHRMAQFLPWENWCRPTTSICFHPFPFYNTNRKNLDKSLTIDGHLHPSRWRWRRWRYVAFVLFACLIFCSPPSSPTFDCRVVVCVCDWNVAPISAAPPSSCRPPRLIVNSLTSVVCRRHRFKFFFSFVCPP